MSAADDRARLARTGIAVSGIARSGLARSGLTLPQLVESLLHKVGALEREMAEFRQAHQLGNQKTLTKRRQAREQFVAQVDRELAKSDELSLTDAITRVLKRRRGWTQLTHPKRRRAITTARDRYNRHRDTRR
jgi:hypothetical protein